MSFPSVTDSAPSEWGGVGVDKEDKELQHPRRERSRENAKAPRVPMKSPKRYPRGLADDDLEETETLFRKETITSSEGHDDISSTTPPDVTGIRLVMINEREYF